MTRNNKTGRKKRSIYIFHTANDEKLVIKPDQDGMSDNYIELLHSLDDEEFLRQRREGRKAIHFDSFTELADDLTDEFNPFLVDIDSDPAKIIIEEEDQEELERLLKKLRRALNVLSDKQIELLVKYYVLSYSQVTLAEEEGVTDAAIRDRLKTIYKKLKKSL